MTAVRQAGDWFTLRLDPAGLILLDQRRLPGEEIYLTLTTLEGVAEAIESLVVRGAPAIGCTAALGMALVARSSRAADLAALRRELEHAAERLSRTRPTAVNLFWALGRMREAFERAASRTGATPALVVKELVDRGEAMVREDVASCRAIGEAGLPLIPDGARILTHCNAGALATGGYGTALGIVRAAADAGRSISVLADETRPFLQGARLTAWELARDGIPVTVVTDGMAGGFEPIEWISRPYWLSA